MRIGKNDRKDGMGNWNEEKEKGAEGKFRRGSGKRKVLWGEKIRKLKTGENTGTKETSRERRETKMTKEMNGNDGEVEGKWKEEE